MGSNTIDKDKCTYGCAPVDIPLALPDHQNTSATLNSAERMKTASRIREGQCPGSAYSSIWDYAAGTDRSALYSTLPPPSGIYCKKHDVVLNLSDYATAQAAVRPQPYTAARDAYIDDDPDCIGPARLGVSTVGAPSTAGQRAGYFQLDTTPDNHIHQDNPNQGCVDLLTFNPKTSTSQT